MSKFEPNSYPLSSYLAEKFNRTFEIYVCPYTISLYSKRTGTFIEYCTVTSTSKSNPLQETEENE
jgi:hypothetical protein